MKFPKLIFVVLALVSSLPVVAADSAYVIDKLLVGVHQDQDLNSAIIKVLPTGTKLEVVKRDGELALIKDPAGTSGWVDAAYLMEEVPATLKIQKLIDENAALTAKLEAAPSSTGDTNTVTGDERDKLTTDNTELKRKLSAEILKSGKLQTKIGQLEAKVADRISTPADSIIAELETANQTLTRELEGAIQRSQKLESQLDEQPGLPIPSVDIESFSLPVLVGFGVALLLAFGAGAYLTDYLARRRHGGFRV
jgi:uncharacterized protein YgiM (DUF1202 family)